MKLDKTEEIVDLIDRGNLKLDQSKYSEARSYYDQAIQIEKSNVPAQLGLLSCEFHTVNRNSALKSLTKLGKKYPSNTSILLIQGELYIIDGDMQNARKCFEKIIVKSLIDVEKRYSRYLIYWIDNDLEGMIIYNQKYKSLVLSYPLFEYYLENLKFYMGESSNLLIANKTIELYPNNYRFYFFRGLLHMKVQNPQSAYDDYNKALTTVTPTISKKQLYDIYLRLGEACSYLFKIDEGIRYTDKAMQYIEDPSNYLDIIKIRYQLNQYVEVIKGCSQLIDSGHDLSQSLFYRGMSYINNIEEDKAENDFKYILKLNNNDSYGYYGLGLIYIKKDIAKAREYFERVDVSNEYYVSSNMYLIECINALMLNDDKNRLIDKTTIQNKEILTEESLGRIYGKLENYGDAILRLSKAIEQNPNSSENYFFRGLARFMIKDESCISDFNNSILINPNNPLGYFGKGLIKEEQERYEEAEILFTKSIQSGQYGCSIYEHRAYVRYQLGKYDEALNDTNEAIKKDIGRALRLRIEKAEILIQLQEWELAKEELELTLKNGTISDSIYLFYAVALSNLKIDESDVIRNLKMALEYNPQNARAYYYLGNIERSKNKYQEAFEQYKKAEILGLKDATTAINEIQKNLNSENHLTEKISIKERVSGLLKTEFKNKVQKGKTVKGTIRLQIIAALKQKYEIDISDNNLRAYLSDLDYVTIRPDSDNHFYQTGKENKMNNDD
jgi:tetratricopeptide (TPR) repeat protein